MNIMQKTGLGLFLIGFLVWIATLTMGKFTLTDQILKENLKPNHYEQLRPSLAPMLNKTYATPFGFNEDLANTIDQVNRGYKIQNQMDKAINDSYAFALTKAASHGMIREANVLLFWASIGLAVVGALIYILAGLRKLPGIKNDHIYHNPGTSRGWLGIIIGTFLILFYVIIYFFPQYIVNWTFLVDPLSRALSGTPASQWFLYGTLYTLAILVMGVRMLIK